MAEHETEFAIDDVESADDRAEIEAALDELDGVSGMEWVDGGERLHVRFDYDLLAEEEVKRTVREMGYGVDGGT